MAGQDAAPIQLVDHTDGSSSGASTSSPHPQPEPESSQQPSRRRHHHHHHTPSQDQPTSVIDVLYENQRGWFIFGIPLFSPRALWNLKIDQAPWVDANFRPSAVDITNAQVPDPSWEWAWKTWYVDMGRERDVDEEGWEYGFWYRRHGGGGLGCGFFGRRGGPTSGWHGNHPWWHSFVRRRRWLRKRVKVSSHGGGTKTKESMFGDAFSVGTSSIFRTSTIGTANNFRDSRVEEAVDEEITDIATLMAILKRSAIDREKIVAVARFVEGAQGEELGYLAEQIPAIMRLLLFQNSRLQLLSNLMNTLDTTKEQELESQAQSQSEKGATTTDTPPESVSQRRLKNLQKAVDAADAECRKLEYWSDIRRLAESGDAGHATDEAHGWHTDQWEGLDGSGPSGPSHKPSDKL